MVSRDRSRLKIRLWQSFITQALEISFLTILTETVIENLKIIFIVVLHFS